MLSEVFLNLKQNRNVIPTNIEGQSGRDTGLTKDNSTDSFQKSGTVNFSGKDLGKVVRGECEELREFQNFLKSHPRITFEAYLKRFSRGKASPTPQKPTPQKRWF